MHEMQNEANKDIRDINKIKVFFFVIIISIN